MSHPRERRAHLSRRDFLRRGAGAAVALRACRRSSPPARSQGPRAASRRYGEYRRARPRPSGQPSDAADDARTDPDGHADRGRNASCLQLGRVLLQEGPAGVRGRVRRDGRVDDVQQHGGGIQKLAAGQIEADVFFPTTDYIRSIGRGGPRPAPQPRADPEPRGELLAGLLRSRAVLRPGLALQRAVRDLRPASRIGATAWTTLPRPRRGTTCSSTPRSRTR